MMIHVVYECRCCLRLFVGFKPILLNKEYDLTSRRDAFCLMQDLQLKVKVSQLAHLCVPEPDEHKAAISVATQTRFKPVGIGELVGFTDDLPAYVAYLKSARGNNDCWDMQSVENALAVEKQYK